MRRTHGRKLSTEGGGDLVGFTPGRITSFNVGEFLQLFAGTAMLLRHAKPNNAVRGARPLPAPKRLVRSAAQTAAHCVTETTQNAPKRPTAHHISQQHTQN
jgi:hypothetical protein